MLKTPDVFLLLCLVGATHGLYKQWIPDTNYENETNWDTGSVPCGRDRVVFPARGSVYVKSPHSVQEMTLPIDGEFILDSGAGFYVGGAPEPGCGTGKDARFKDSDSLQWFDPALWRAAVTPDDLKSGPYLFSVHEDSVPCEHDDVVFKASTSFRVDTTSDGVDIPVKSVSVLGKTFKSQSDLSRYLGTASGRTQFHKGSDALALRGSDCGDASGCACDNSANRARICARVTCPSLTCEKPLRPVGHCCDVCGAIITIDYAPIFNLQSYRQRVQDLFLDLPAFKTIRLGMSKVSKPQYLMGMVRVGASDKIQMVLLDGEADPQSGTVSEALARVILDDIRSHGSELGIADAEVQPEEAVSHAGVVVGAILGVLILAALIGVSVFLVRKGHVQMPSISMPAMPSLRGMKKNGDVGDLGGPLDLGYDNPMFDKPTLMPAVPTIYGAEVNSISMTSSGVHFVNPAYDDNEADLTV
ncbi:unnamed protein product [Merluccius merluccius]